jgi:hypothetical protein
MVRKSSIDKAQIDPARRGQTVAEFCAEFRIPPKGWTRLRSTGGTPRLTRVTEKKEIITPEHRREWVEARSTPAPNPSPFPDDGGDDDSV